MSRITVDSATLEVNEAGSGPVLLLVHGFPLDHQMWRHQIDAFATTHRVIAPDLRGFGLSTVTPGIVTMERYADDLALLLDAMEIREPITFCGLSMGGYIAWQFVDRHRTRLAKLILCDTKAAPDTPEAAKARLENAQKVLEEGPQVIVDGMLPKLFAPQSQEKLPDIVRATRKIMLNTKAEGVAAALRGMAERPDMRGRLGNYDLPTLVICGQHDAIASVAEMRTIADALPEGRFVEIAEAGHMSPLEQPEAVNEAMKEFLSR